MIEGVKFEKAKKVETYDANKKNNGHLIELFKDGDKTVAYKTTIDVGGFKGYHLHRIRAAHYVCLKGKIKVILYQGKNKEEHIMDASDPSRLFIPPNVATGIKNIGDEDAWIINFPNPAYDPHLKGEQVEYTQEELEQGIVK